MIQSWYTRNLLKKERNKEEGRKEGRKEVKEGRKKERSLVYSFVIQKLYNNTIIIIKFESVIQIFTIKRCHNPSGQRNLKNTQQSKEVIKLSDHERKTMGAKERNRKQDGNC